MFKTFLRQQHVSLFCFFFNIDYNSEQSTWEYQCLFDFFVSLFVSCFVLFFVFFAKLDSINVISFILYIKYNT